MRRPLRTQSAVVDKLPGSQVRWGEIVSTTDIQGSARYFAVPSKDTSEAWAIQCAILLACYERMGTITTTPIHRGWRLLAAFDSHVSLTDKLNHTVSEYVRGLVDSVPVAKMSAGQCKPALTIPDAIPSY